MKYSTCIRSNSSVIVTIWMGSLAFSSLSVSCTQCEHSPSAEMTDICSKQEDPSSSVSNTNALAVVPFNENHLSLFYKPEREFTFAGRRMVIKQAWSSSLGVSAVVWDAAVVLSEYLEKSPELVRGKRVLELGAGSGIVGLTLAYLGGNVTVTERDVAMDYLRSVIKENTDPSKDVVTAKFLDWTSDLSSFTENFDLVLGADIIYIEETFTDLLTTILHVCSKNTTLVLSCKVRYERDSKFINMLKKYFTVKKIYVDTSRDILIYKAVKL